MTTTSRAVALAMIDPTGGGAEISNINSLGGAKGLALVLASGALPFQYALIR